MAKIKHTTTANGNSVSFTNTNPTTTTTTTKNSNGGKMKRKRKSLPRDSPLQRSSVYRGVTRHRWTGRYEAHLWDKNCWNESQNKKGKQVYLGAYDGEEAAAHAYDLAALKYWGHETILNFPASTYEGEMQELEGQSKEEYIGSLRRKSSGFSRGVSKYRGVARHHHNGRWEARIGRVFGNKYLYLGTYATQEEAATAYDMAAIEYRGLNAVTNFDLSRYIKWLRPNRDGPNADTAAANSVLDQMSSNPAIDIESNNFLQHQQGGIGELSDFPQARPGASATASSALGLLFQSPKFKEMLERTSEASSSSSAPPPNCESRPSGCSFPEDIQTYFECEDTANFANGEDAIFGDLNQFVSSIFACELDA